MSYFLQVVYAKERAQGAFVLSVPDPCSGELSKFEQLQFHINYPK